MYQEVREGEVTTDTYILQGRARGKAGEWLEAGQRHSISTVRFYEQHFNQAYFYVNEPNPICTRYNRNRILSLFHFQVQD